MEDAEVLYHWWVVSSLFETNKDRISFKISHFSDGFRWCKRNRI